MCSCPKVRELSSAGRASALQAEGHRFEPYSSHQKGLYKSFFKPVHTGFGPVVQLVRTPPCHGGGREFESHPGRQFVFGLAVGLYVTVRK